jgi:hypothetical protein
MAVYRVHLKRNEEPGITEAALFEFCRSQSIIGVGWSFYQGHDDLPQRNERLAELYAEKYPDEPKAKLVAARKAINAVAKMKFGDFVWAREGGVYYLCKVTTPWKERVVRSEHEAFDIANYVGVEWKRIGTEEMIPGAVVRSLSYQAAAQAVEGVDNVTQAIWEAATGSIPDNKRDCVWKILGHEEIEVIFLLYLQHLGYYIYTNTVKKSTKRVECVMVSHDGSHRAYPQAKANQLINAEEYIDLLSSPQDRVYLFSTTENYKKIDDMRVIYCTRSDLEHFVIDNYRLMPDNIRYFVSLSDLGPMVQ